MGVTGVGSEARLRRRLCRSTCPFTHPRCLCHHLCFFKSRRDKKSDRRESSSLSRRR